MFHSYIIIGACTHIVHALIISCSLLRVFFKKCVAPKKTIFLFSIECVNNSYLKVLL